MVREQSIRGRVIGTGLLALALGVFFAKPSRAQPTFEGPRDFSVERLRPAKAHEGILDAEWGRVAGHGSWDLSLWFWYVRAPLVLQRDNARVGTLVEERLTADLVGAVSLFDRIELGFELPLVLSQARPEPLVLDGQTVPIEHLGAVGISDLRVAPKIGLLTQEGQGFDLAVLATISIPTGSSNDYRGEPGFVLVPELALSRTAGPVAVAINLGYTIRPATELLGLAIDDELTYRAGIAYRLDEEGDLPLEVAASLSGALAANAPFSSSNESPLEVLLGTRYAVAGGLSVVAGAGLGIGSGYGVPRYRFLGALQYAHRDDDKDDDGIVDRDDKCATAPEDKDGFDDLDGCPDPDNDQDGIADGEDAAPDAPEDKDGFEDGDGAPDPDNDQDGVLDGDDTCPNEQGPAANKGCPDHDSDGDGVNDRADRCPSDAEDVDGFADDDGCPDLDNDDDGVADAADNCPSRAGPMENRGCPDVDTDGDGVVDRIDNCPAEVGPVENQGCQKKQLVQISQARLEILEKVYFASGKAVIRKRSFPLLNNIAAVLESHPEIKKVVIEGHTDNVGGEARNRRLSQGRADAVRTYLLMKGIAPERLEAVGYGESRPIATNKSRAGRSENRRVEFVIRP